MAALYCYSIERHCEFRLRCNSFISVRSQLINGIQLCTCIYIYCLVMMNYRTQTCAYMCAYTYTVKPL